MGNRGGCFLNLPSRAPASLLDVGIPAVLRMIMSPPAVYREMGFRFSFYSDEEPRVHIHVKGSSGKAKFWIEPENSFS